MSDTLYRAPRADQRAVVAAQIALAWVVLFIGFHVYWSLGGSFVSPGKLPGNTHTLLGWTFQVLVLGMFVLGFLVPLAISRGWVGPRFVKPVAILVRLGAVILVLRGGSGLVDDLTRAAGVRTGISGISTGQATGTTRLTWSWWAIETYFLVGGMIFTWLAVRLRQPRHPRARRSHEPVRAIRSR